MGGAKQNKNLKGEQMLRSLRIIDKIKYCLVIYYTNFKSNIQTMGGTIIH